MQNIENAPVIQRLDDVISTLHLDSPDDRINGLRALERMAATRVKFSTDEAIQILVALKLMLHSSDAMNRSEAFFSMSKICYSIIAGKSEEDVKHILSSLFQGVNISRNGKDLRHLSCILGNMAGYNSIVDSKILDLFMESRSNVNYLGYALGKSLGAKHSMVKKYLDLRFLKDVVSKVFEFVEPLRLPGPVEEYMSHSLKKAYPIAESGSHDAASAFLRSTISLLNTNLDTDAQPWIERIIRNIADEIPVKTKLETIKALVNIVADPADESIVEQDISDSYMLGIAGVLLNSIGTTSTSLLALLREITENQDVPSDIRAEVSELLQARTATPVDSNVEQEYETVARMLGVCPPDASIETWLSELRKLAFMLNDQVHTTSDTDMVITSMTNLEAISVDAWNILLKTMSRKHTSEVVIGVLKVVGRDRIWNTIRAMSNRQNNVDDTVSLIVQIGMARESIPTEFGILALNHLTNDLGGDDLEHKISSIASVVEVTSEIPYSLRMTILTKLTEILEDEDEGNCEHAAEGVGRIVRALGTISVAEGGKTLQVLGHMFENTESRSSAVVSAVISLVHDIDVVSQDQVNQTLNVLMQDLYDEDEDVRMDAVSGVTGIALRSDCPREVKTSVLDALIYLSNNLDDATGSAPGYFCHVLSDAISSICMSLGEPKRDCEQKERYEEAEEQREAEEAEEQREAEEAEEQREAEEAEEQEEALYHLFIVRAQYAFKEQELISSPAGTELLYTAHELGGQTLQNALLDVMYEEGQAINLLSRAREIGSKGLVLEIMAALETAGPAKETIETNHIEQETLVVRSTIRKGGGIDVQQTIQVGSISHQKTKVSSTITSIIEKLTNKLDVIWKYKLCLHKADIARFSQILKDNDLGTLTSLDILRDEAKFKKSVLLKLHPDKGGKAEDFAFVRGLQEKMKADIDINAIIAEKAAKIQVAMYKASLGIKVADTVVDVLRVVNKPTFENSKELVLDVAHLYGMYKGLNGYGLAIGTLEATYQAYQGEYAEALKHVVITGAYMTLPVVMAATGVPYASLAFAVVMTAYSGYHLLYNVHSLYTECTSDDNAAKSSEVDVYLYNTLVKTPLEYVYESEPHSVAVENDVQLTDEQASSLQEAVYDV
ncbi:hypothetical protein [Rickettsiales endosymbiont of Peranema trichophorum]|uniref:hypothetical protein n=1 Tax=Rickettsiales endosymbiont of Peranema trichophorum TaxID=2486577 RepID=UPI0013EE4D25|nr:hypothetical protein [Rickettsiales endosymbiont of Peranema trichophorum]